VQLVTLRWVQTVSLVAYACSFSLLLYAHPLRNGETVSARMVDKPTLTQVERPAAVANARNIMGPAEHSPAEGTSVPEDRVENGIEKVFLAAVQHMRSNKTLRLSQASKLQVYGLYKQALEGDVSCSRPGVFDPVGGAKWDAWASLKGLSANAARQRYIDLVASYSTTWKMPGVCPVVEELTVVEASELIPGISHVGIEDNDIKHVCPKQFERVLQRRVIMLKENAFSKDGENGWKYNFSESGVDCFLGAFDGLTAGKGTGILNFPPRAVFDMLVECGNPDDPGRKCYIKDPDMEFLEKVDEYNGHTWSTYSRYKSFMFVSGRDFYNLIHWRVEDSGTILFIGGSLESTTCPPKRGLVRGELVIGGWVLRPVNGGNATEVSYVVNLDLKGKIPSIIVNQIVTKQPMQINIIRRFLDEKMEKEGKQAFLEKYRKLGVLKN
jgi:diazepam-binding inhibitor (GABA receptor modulator, acyl-CoA-binding protein)